MGVDREELNNTGDTLTAGSAYGHSTGSPVISQSGGYRVCQLAAIIYLTAQLNAPPCEEGGYVHLAPPYGNVRKYTRCERTTKNASGLRLR